MRRNSRGLAEASMKHIQPVLSCRKALEQVNNRRSIVSTIPQYDSLKRRHEIRIKNSKTNTKTAAMPSPHKTAIVTGSANGIGAQTILTYYSLGFNVIIADLPSSQAAAEALIASLEEPSRALYHPTNIVNWSDMLALFRGVKERFGGVHVVVANAGMMESMGFSFGLISWRCRRRGKRKRKPVAGWGVECVCRI
jgi:hypothetical protein